METPNLANASIPSGKKWPKFQKITENRAHTMLFARLDFLYTNLANSMVCARFHDHTSCHIYAP